MEIAEQLREIKVDSPEDYSIIKDAAAYIELLKKELESFWALRDVIERDIKNG